MTGKIVLFPGVEADAPAPLFGNAPDIMSIPQVAELLGVSQATVRREISNGRLASIRVGTCVRVTRLALLEYVWGNGGD